MSSRSPSRSAQQWSAIIAKYRAGSESDVEYCQRLQLNFTFRKHKYARNKFGRVRAKPAFQEVKVTPPYTAGVITVHAYDGVRIEMPVTVDMNTVVQLAQALSHEH